MKRRIHLFGLLTLSVGMALALMLDGCDALTKASQIDVPIEVSVPINGTGNVIPKTTTDCQDLSTNKDFMDNKDKIASGTVSQAYLFLNGPVNPVYSDPSVTTSNAIFSKVSFYLTFPAEYNDPKQYKLGEFTNVKLTDLMAPGTTGKGYSIPVSSDVNEAINLLRQRPKFCTVSAYGTLQNGATAKADLLTGTLKFTLAFKVNVL